MPQDDAAWAARRGDELPEELRRREERLATIEAAKQRLEEQAQAAAEAERQRRAEAEAERQRTGKKRRGREPGPIVETPDGQGADQLHRPRVEDHADGATRAGSTAATPRRASMAPCQIILAC